MEILSITEIWKYFRWVPGFVMSRLFTKERLADLVLIDVKPRHESVRVNLGEVASYDLWFQVINMSPFPIELDRAEIIFSCIGTRLKTHYIKKTKYQPGEVSSLYINGDIDSDKADRIAKLYNKNTSSISLHCEFNCNLHDFTKTQDNLEGVNTIFINEQWRITKLEKQ